MGVSSSQRAARVGAVLGQRVSLYREVRVAQVSSTQAVVVSGGRTVGQIYESCIGSYRINRSRSKSNKSRRKVKGMQCLMEKRRDKKVCAHECFGGYEGARRVRRARELLEVCMVLGRVGEIQGGRLRTG